MSTISSTTTTSDSILAGLSGSSSTSSSSSSTSSSSDSSSLGKTEFLQLLVTQLNNQNPLDPQDNSEFVAQLAQFSSVESLQNLNSSVESIISNYQSSQALQASSLVGRSVLANTSQAAVDTSSAFYGSLDLGSAATDVKVAVYNSTGEKVKTIELGTQKAGSIDFSWDGAGDDGTTLASGSYTFKATGTIDGTETALTTYLPATISSVTLGQNGDEMSLNLSGGGSIALSKVKMIGQ